MEKRRRVLTIMVPALQTCAPESAQPLPAGPCPQDWPSRGEITFRDYRMRYRDGTPLVLDGLDLHIRSGQTVGIVGRTGSGEDRLHRASRSVPARVAVPQPQTGRAPLRSLYCKYGSGLDGRVELEANTHQFLN